jgi:hypothetical protein
MRVSGCSLFFLMNVLGVDDELGSPIRVYVESRH